MLSPIVALLRTAVEVQSSLALFERIFTYLDLPHDIIDAPDAMELPPQRALGAISFRDVSFRHPSSNGSVSGRWVPKDLTFHVEPGQFAAVVGPTGSGKTTLSYLLARLYDVTQGAMPLS